MSEINLEITPAKVVHVIYQAREGALAYAELHTFIANLNVDEKAHLTAVAGLVAAHSSLRIFTRPPAPPMPKRRRPPRIICWACRICLKIWNPGLKPWALMFRAKSKNSCKPGLTLGFCGPIYANIGM